MKFLIRYRFVRAHRVYREALWPVGALLVPILFAIVITDQAARTWLEPLLDEISGILSALVGLMCYVFCETVFIVTVRTCLHRFGKKVRHAGMEVGIGLPLTTGLLSAIQYFPHVPTWTFLLLAASFIVPATAYAVPAVIRRLSRRLPPDKRAFVETDHEWLRVPVGLACLWFVSLLGSYVLPAAAEATRDYKEAKQRNAVIEAAIHRNSRIGVTVNPGRGNAP